MWCKWNRSKWQTLQSDCFMICLKMTGMIWFDTRITKEIIINPNSDVSFVVVMRFMYTRIQQIIYFLLNFLSCRFSPISCYIAVYTIYLLTVFLVNSGKYWPKFARTMKNARRVDLLVIISNCFLVSSGNIYQNLQDLHERSEGNFK